MSILVHKAGIGKTTGQKSNPNRTTEDGSTIDFLQPNLHSFFNPSSNIVGTAPAAITWEPTHGYSSLKLRLFNGPTKQQTTSPHYISFDGVNDYIGPTSTGYGGNPVKLDNAYWTIGCWVYANWSGNTTLLFCVQEPDSSASTPGFFVEVDNVGTIQVIGNNSANGLQSTNSTLADNKWSFISLSYETGTYYLYVNGRFVGSGNEPDTLTNVTGEPFGFAHNLRGGVNYNSNSTLRLGRLYIYRTAAIADRLFASKHRFLFLASHDMHNGKYYGSDIASY